MKSTRLAKAMLRCFALCLVIVLGTLPLAFATSTGAINDGEYRSTVKGYGGNIVMDVTVADGKLTAIQIVNHEETEEYGGRAVDELPGRVLEQQSLGCDTVSGATITSRAIFKGIADAIGQAGGNAADFGYVSVEDISAADTVVFTGLPGGKEAAYTGAQFMALPGVTVNAQSVNASGAVSDTNATGVLLETVLGELGVSQKDYEAIVMTASDGYSIEIPRSVLQHRDVIIAWEVNGEAHSPRTIVPEERAMYWVKFLTNVELKGEVKTVPVETVGILEAMIDGLPGEDYKYYDAMDEAVPVSAIFDKYVTAKAEFVTLSSIDDWEKNDKYDTVAAQFIKSTGEYAPMFIGPTLPEGMRLKHTLRMQIGNESIISAQMAMQYAGVAAGESLPLATLFEIAGIVDAQSYLFEAADGYQVEISREDIGKGAILVTDGSVRVDFDGLPKNTTVKELLYIKANVS